MTRKPEVKVVAADYETTMTLNGRTIGSAWQSLDGFWWVRYLDHDPVRAETRDAAWDCLLPLIEQVARGEIR